MLIWKEEFSTGIVEIDTAHKRLIAGLNQLEAALQGGKGSKAVPALLSFLETYADQHFIHEEACMNRLKCPTAAANKAAHDSFRATFAKAKERIRSPAAGALVALQVHRELCDWISNHILRVDGGLKACLPRQPAVRSAAGHHS